ncbi:MAG: hypothetical protein AB8G22_29470 [Saprospiraceae bacterium]
MKSANLTLPTSATSNTITTFLKKVKDIITLKAYRDLLNMDFDLELNREDLEVMYGELCD